MGLSNLPGGMPIIVSKFHPKHPTRRYTVQYPAHPLVCWLARFLPITPYIEASYPDDADPYFLALEDKIVMGQRTYDHIVKVCSNETP